MGDVWMFVLRIKNYETLLYTTDFFKKNTFLKMEKERKNFQLNYHHQVSEIPFCPSEASIHFILGSNRSNKDALIKLGAVAPIIPADGKLRQGVASHPKHSTFYDSLGYKVRFCLKKSSKQTTKYKMLCYVCTVACRHDFQI